MNTDIEATVVNRRVQPTFYLKGVSDKVTDKVFPLSSNTKFGSTTVGRDKDCHIVIDDPGVSRRHAAFHVEEGAVLLEDLESANGTFVNQVSINKQELYPGDLVAFDKVQFKLEVLGDVVKPGGARPNNPAAAPEAPRVEPKSAALTKPWARTVIWLALLALAGVLGYSLRGFW